MADFGLYNAGSLFLLYPMSDEAEKWVDEYIDPEAQHWGHAVVIEHRYVGDIVVGIEMDGMTITESTAPLKEYENV